jgi:hypothetical protein
MITALPLAAGVVLAAGTSAPPAETWAETAAACINQHTGIDGSPKAVAVLGVVVAHIGSQAADDLIEDFTNNQIDVLLCVVWGGGLPETYGDIDMEVIEVPGSEDDLGLRVGDVELGFIVEEDNVYVVAGERQP